MAKISNAELSLIKSFKASLEAVPVGVDLAARVIQVRFFDDKPGRSSNCAVLCDNFTDDRRA